MGRFLCTTPSQKKEDEKKEAVVDLENINNEDRAQVAKEGDRLVSQIPTHNNMLQILVFLCACSQCRRISV